MREPLDPDLVAAVLRLLPSRGWTAGMLGRRNKALLVLAASTDARPPGAHCHDHRAVGHPRVTTWSPLSLQPITSRACGWLQIMEPPAQSTLGTQVPSSSPYRPVCRASRMELPYCGAAVASSEVGRVTMHAAHPGQPPAAVARVRTTPR